MPAVYREFINDLENHWTMKWNGGVVPDNKVAQTIAAATDISSAVVLSKTGNCFCSTPLSLLQTGSTEIFQTV